MQPKKYKSKELNLRKFYPTLFLIATLFMSVAYAQISGVTLTIEGTTSGDAQSRSIHNRCNI